MIRLTLQERIIKNSQKSDVGCWLWLLSPGFDGYGKIKYQKATLRAHRASWMAFRGDLPNDMFVCHSCDNPLCVNPEHLFLGSAQENMTDKMNKNRWSGGRPTWKLDEYKVKLIRMLGNRITTKRWAEEFGVTVATIKYIKNGKIWTQVQDVSCHA